MRQVLTRALRVSLVYSLFRPFPAPPLPPSELFHGFHHSNSIKILARSCALRWEPVPDPKKKFFWQKQSRKIYVFAFSGPFATLSENEHVPVSFLARPRAYLKVAQAWHERVMSRIEKNRKTCQKRKSAISNVERARYFCQKRRFSNTSISFLAESAVPP